MEPQLTVPRQVHSLKTIVPRQVQTLVRQKKYKKSDCFRREHHDMWLILFWDAIKGKINETMERFNPKRRPRSSK